MRQLQKYLWNSVGVPVQYGGMTFQDVTLISKPGTKFLRLNKLKLSVTWTATRESSANGIKILSYGIFCPIKY